MVELKSFLLLPTIMWFIVMVFAQAGLLFTIREHMNLPRIVEWIILGVFVAAAANQLSRGFIV